MKTTGIAKSTSLLPKNKIATPPFWKLCIGYKIYLIITLGYKEKKTSFFPILFHRNAEVLEDLGSTLATLWHWLVTCNPFPTWSPGPRSSIGLRSLPPEPEQQLFETVQFIFLAIGILLLMNKIWRTTWDGG